MFEPRKMAKQMMDVYKVRTMHSYAQYLHDYMLENYGFDDSFKDRSSNAASL